MSPYLFANKQPNENSRMNVMQKQNDFLRDWVPLRHSYLSCLLQLEGPRDDRRCMSCNDRDGSWRCLDCLSTPQLCIGCCRESHTRLPFHRVERWTGAFYAPAWLRDVGVVINLGHGGKPCSSVGAEVSLPYCGACRSHIYHV